MSALRLISRTKLYWGLIAVNVAFQTGFCAFVLSNYMKSIPREIYESAVVDGAGVMRQFWQLTLPLCRPALGVCVVVGRGRAAAGCSRKRPQAVTCRSPTPSPS